MHSGVEDMRFHQLVMYLPDEEMLSLVMGHDSDKTGMQFATKIPRFEVLNLPGEGMEGL